MSSTQGHTNINTTYTTIDISSILSEINRIADETYLRGVEEGHRIANMERADLLDKVAEKFKENINTILGEPNYQHDGETWQNGLIIASDNLDELIDEMKAEAEEVR